MTSIQYDSVQILNSTYNPRFIQHESAPERDLSLEARGREDGDVLISERYGVKTILLQGTLVGSDSEDLEAKIDSFKELFSREQKNLDISWDGGTRRYVATCRSHNFVRDHGNIDFVPWTAEFVVPLGIGRATTETTLASLVSLSPNTSGIATTSIYTFQGSRKPLPIIRITADADGDPVYFPVSVRGLELKNVTTGEAIQIALDVSWANADKYIEFDFESKKVLSNLDTPTAFQREIPFFGNFPSVNLGANTFQITFGGIVNQDSLEGNANIPALGGLSRTQITSSSQRIAQSFVVPYTSSTFRSFNLGLMKVGSPGNWTIRIETDDGDDPSGTLVDASATATGNQSVIASGTPAKYLLEYTDKFTLIGGRQYWIVFSATSVDADNRYEVPQGANLYPKGYAKFSGDGGSTYSLLGSLAQTSLAFTVRYGGIPEDITWNPRLSIRYTKLYL